MKALLMVALLILFISCTPAGGDNDNSEMKDFFLLDALRSFLGRPDQNGQCPAGYHRAGLLVGQLKFAKGGGNGGNGGGNGGGGGNDGGGNGGGNGNGAGNNSGGGGGNGGDNGGNGNGHTDHGNGNGYGHCKGNGNGHAGSEGECADDNGSGNGGGNGGNGGGNGCDSHNMVIFCHKPGTPAEKTMNLNECAWQNGHSGHGDTLGECNTDDGCVPDDPDDPTDPEDPQDPGDNGGKDGSNVGGGSCRDDHGLYRDLTSGEYSLLKKDLLKDKHVEWLGKKGAIIHVVNGQGSYWLAIAYANRNGGLDHEFMKNAEILYKFKNHYMTNDVGQWPSYRFGGDTYHYYYIAISSDRFIENRFSLLRGFSQVAIDENSLPGDRFDFTYYNQVCSPTPYFEDLLHRRPEFADTEHDYAEYTGIWNLTEIGKRTYSVIVGGEFYVESKDDGLQEIETYAAPTYGFRFPYLHFARNAQNYPIRSNFDAGWFHYNEGAEFGKFYNLSNKSNLCEIVKVYEFKAYDNQIVGQRLQRYCDPETNGFVFPNNLIDFSE